MSIAKAAFSGLRTATRALRRSPGIPVTVFASILAATSFVVASTSLLETILLRPLPYPEPERLIWVAVRSARQTSEGVSFPTFFYWQRENHSLAGLAAFTGKETVLEGGGQIQRATIGWVSANLFRVLGVSALYGRTLEEGDDRRGAAPVLVLGYELGQNLFGNARNAVGHAVRIGEQEYAVVGVMPPKFGFPGGATQVWSAVQQEFGATILAKELTFLKIVARMKQGVGISAVRNELDALLRRDASYNPATQWRTEIVPLREHLVGATRTPLLLVSFSAYLLLLIAAVNATCLLLTKAIADRAEIAVMKACGAGEAHLAKRLFMNGGLYAFAGGVAGVALSVALLHTWFHAGVARIPRFEEGAHVNWVVIALGLLVSFMVTLIVSTAPMRFARNVPAAEAFKEAGPTVSGGARGDRHAAALLVFQVSAAMVLLTMSGGLARSFLETARADPGFHAQGILTTYLTRPIAVLFDRDVVALRTFARELFEELSSLPGSDGVALADAEPLAEFNMRGVVAHGADTTYSGVEGVTASYWGILGIRVIEGTAFHDAIAGDELEVVINQTLSGRLFGSRSALGQSLTVAPMGDQLVRVVGIVGDTRHDGLGAAPPPILFYSFLAMPSPTIHVFVRTTRTPLQIRAPMLNAVRRLDPRQRMGDLRWLDDVVWEHSLLPRTLFGVVGSFALFGLVLCAMGMYSLMAYFVAVRAREIWIRVAVGARPFHILRWILLKAAKLSFIGCVVGFALSYMAGKALQANVYAVDGSRLPSLIALGVILFGALGLAAYPAARKAASIDAAALSAVNADTWHAGNSRTQPPKSALKTN